MRKHGTFMQRLRPGSYTSSTDSCNNFIGSAMKRVCILDTTENQAGLYQVVPETIRERSSVWEQTSVASLPMIRTKWQGCGRTAPLPFFTHFDWC